MAEEATSMLPAFALLLLLFGASKAFGSRSSQALTGGVTVTEGGILSAVDAQKLIKAGRVNDVLKAPVSRWFDWKETVRNAGELKIAADRGVLSNIQRHAQNMDRLRDAYGKPIVIESWFRSESTTYHGKGLASDIRGNRATHVAIWNKAIDLNWQGGKGIADPGHPNILHFDSGPNRAPWPYRNGQYVQAVRPFKKLAG